MAEKEHVAVAAFMRHVPASKFQACCAVQSTLPFTLEDLDAIDSRGEIYITCPDDQERKKKGNPRSQWSLPIAGRPHEPGRIGRRIRPAILEQSRISNPHHPAACSITHGLHPKVSAS